MIKKKYHKIKKIYIQKNKNNSGIKEGILGLKSLKHGLITDNQIESARKIITKFTRRICKIWIKINKPLPITNKGIGTRMGKGVGNICAYIYYIQKGTILLELIYSTFFSHIFIKEILLCSIKKLPIPFKISFKKIKGL